jgi:hypothetical protein
MEISIPGLERAAASGWRGTEEASLGGWLLRAAGGFTGRANSALAIGDPGMPLAAAPFPTRSAIRAAARSTGSSAGVAGPCDPARRR